MKLKKYGLLLATAATVLALAACTDKEEETKTDFSKMEGVQNGDKKPEVVEVEVDTEGVERSEYNSEGIRDVVIEESGEKLVEKKIVIYRPNSQADEVNGFASAYPMEDAKDFNLLNFVTFLTNQSNTMPEQVKLESVSMLEDDKVVLLNFGSSLQYVQGSAGGQMFMDSITYTIFGNTTPEEVQGVILGYSSGSPETDVLDHVTANQIITREEFDKTNK